ncbi:MAG: RNase P/RNase MRP subunit POP5 [Candidatus Woesearchaeota archaeon]|jgi:RNase P/RNase MRP subunit POP5
MKPLPKSQRVANRYIGFQIDASEKISQTDAKTSIFEAIQKFIGELGMAKAQPIIRNYTDNQGLIQTNPTYVAHVRAALLLITNIHKKPVRFVTNKTSGQIANVKG